jgi:outer membrane lipoprotein-sorting protein
VIGLLCGFAFADDADALLTRVEAASHTADDAHLVLDVRASDSSGDAARTLEIWQKGDKERLVTFVAPARLAGVSLLVPDGETLYLYLPAYGNARRVVGESRGDAFLGTDFAMDDLSRLSWRADYTPTAASADHLTLAAIDPKKAPSARVEMTLRAEDALLVSVEHYDAAGTLLRRITFDDFRAEGTHTLAHTISVEDVKRSRTTTATVTSAEFDLGLTDDRFAITALGK